MVSDRKIAATFAAAALLTAATGVVAAAAAGIDPGLALRTSARLALLLLLVVFVARPLRDLAPTPFTAGLLRNRALLGAAFAGVHSGHLLLVIHKAQTVAGVELRVSDNLPGAFTYLVIFAMLATTFSGPRRAIGPRAWRILHKAGLYWLAFAFLNSQLPDRFAELKPVNGLLLLLFAAAVILRVTAFLVRRRAKPG